MNPPYPRPKKRLGQHFLTDHNILRKIISTAKLNKENVVLEIGPGCGALTRFLCQSVAKVIAVEVDAELVAYLNQSFSGIHNLELHNEDALRFPYQTVPSGTIVVANLPYHVSTPLLFKLFEGKGRMDRMVLMLQLEVARRVVAKPGNREYGTLSVYSQYFSIPTLAFKIPRTCFRPRPDVDSAVVTFDLSRGQSRPKGEDAALMHVVRVAFAHRRKTLGNSFRDSGYGPSDVQKIFSKTGIDVHRRAETLSVVEFITLADAFKKVFRPSAPTTS